MKGACLLRIYTHQTLQGCCWIRRGNRNAALSHSVEGIHPIDLHKRQMRAFQKGNDPGWQRMKQYNNESNGSFLPIRCSPERSFVQNSPRPVVISRFGGASEWPFGGVQKCDKP